MLISICIPTFNREKELEKQLYIFFKQVKNLKYNYNLAVSDNGSNDNSKKILLKYKKKFSKLKNVTFTLNFNKKNLGYNKNLLKSLKICSGNYAVILADDDFPSGKFYKKIHEYLSKKKPKGILFVPMSKKYITKKLNNRTFLMKLIQKLKTYVFSFSYINQRSGSMSGIIIKPDLILLEKQFIGKKNLYPQIHISLNYYLKYGFHPINFNEFLDMTTQVGGIVNQIDDAMDRPEDYGIIERFNIIEMYKKKKLISKVNYFGAFVELCFWFYDIKYKVMYEYKNIAIVNQFNEAILPNIKNRVLFYTVSFLLIILPIKRTDSSFKIRKYILKEILSFYKYKKK